MSALDDQHVAGLVMALEQSIIMGIALAYLFIRMLAESEDGEEPPRRALRRGVGLSFRKDAEVSDGPPRRVPATMPADAIKPDEIDQREAEPADLGAERDRPRAARSGRSAPRSARAAVTEGEAPERLRLEVRVDRKHEVRDHEHEAGGQVHVRGEPEAEPDERGRGGVGEVVEVVTCTRGRQARRTRAKPTLRRVAEPVDDEQRSRRPQVPGRRRDGERDRSRERQRGEAVRPDLGGKPPRDRLEEPLLRPRQQERLVAALRQFAGVRPAVGVGSV